MVVNAFNNVHQRLTAICSCESTCTGNLCLRVKSVIQHNNRIMSSNGEMADYFGTYLTDIFLLSLYLLLYNLR